MSKIPREMYESCLRDLIWQAAEELGAAAATKMINMLIAEYNQELADYTAETGVIISKPERVA